MDSREGSPSIDTINNTNWAIGVAEDNGGALAMFADASSTPFVPISSSATVDRIDVAMGSGRIVWMYTVTGGDPVGIYYAHG